VVARDAQANEGSDQSDAAFEIGVDITGFEDVLPAAFRLGPIAPNPVRSTAVVMFALPVESGVRVSVLDVSGREVAVLCDERLPAGYHRAVWDGAGTCGPVGSGVYFIRLRAGKAVFTEKIVALP
jgi:hypothetical protein